MTDFHLALEVDGGGAHPAAGPPPDIETLAGYVRAAEAAGFALVTIADSPLPPGNGFDRAEAGVRAAYLARRTTGIGIAPQLHVTATEPFHVATQLASLDHASVSRASLGRASLGRAGWVLGADPAFATVGEPELTGDDLRREIMDAVDVARLLWDSWEDGAVIRDVASGRFLDPDRVHHVSFRGARYDVIGPLITPRPPQGHPVVLGADTLGVTDRLDVALVAASTVEELATRTAQAREQGARLVFAEVEIQPAEEIQTAENQPAENRTGENQTGGDGTFWPATDRLRHIGGLRELRDLLGTIVDGARLHPAVLARDVPVLTAEKFGESKRTLRETLGLARPVNVFEGAR